MGLLTDGIGMLEIPLSYNRFLSSCRLFGSGMKFLRSIYIKKKSQSEMFEKYNKKTYPFTILLRRSVVILLIVWIIHLRSCVLLYGQTLFQNTFYF